MTEDGFDRRSFLKGTVVGGAAAIASSLPKRSEAQPKAAAVEGAPPAAYAFLNADEAAFVEAVVDHMIPADDYSPKGTDFGLDIYIDRALAGGWGKGDRLYMQGPWKQGVPSQGYQLPLTPAELYRAGIAATNAALREDIRQAVRQDQRRPAPGVPHGVAGGQGRRSRTALPPRVFFGVALPERDEGMFADPIYGGNRDKAGWKMIGFPGVIAVHYAEHREVLRDKKLPDVDRRSASRTSAERAPAMATKLKEVDVVIVGLGWTGGILAKELARRACKVVALERGSMRTTAKDFAVPQVRDELRYVSRHELMQNAQRDTLTIRNNPSQTALPMRRLGSFLPGEGSAARACTGAERGAGRTSIKVRCHYEERYGKEFIPADMTIQDWGITYAELEPYYDKFEYVRRVRQGGQPPGRDPAGRQPLRGAAAARLPLPALTPSSPGSSSHAAAELGLSPVSASQRERLARLHQSRRLALRRLPVLRPLRDVRLRGEREGQPAHHRHPDGDGEAELRAAHPLLGDEGADGLERQEASPASPTPTCSPARSSSSRRRWCCSARTRSTTSTSCCSPASASRTIPRRRRASSARTTATRLAPAATLFFEGKNFNPFMARAAPASTMDDFNANWEFDRATQGGFVGGYPSSRRVQHRVADRLSARARAARRRGARSGKRRRRSGTRPR